MDNLAINKSLVTHKKMKMSEYLSSKAQVLTATISEKVEIEISGYFELILKVAAMIKGSPIWNVHTKS